MMTVVMGFLALVLDIGNAYAQRRYMQNAADAAAMAAARHLSTTMATGTSDGAIIGILNSYLAANGQGATIGTAGLTNAWYTNNAGVRVGTVGSGIGIPATPLGGAPSIVGVEVSAARNVNTFFARVIGYSTISVRAAGSAAYGNASSVLFDSTRSGVPLGPMVFDVQAYQNGVNICGGYGAALQFSLYVDTPSDCVSGPDMHFSYSTLNIGSNCSNSTVMNVTEDLINDPTSFGDQRVELNSDSIRICHGARLSNPDLITAIGRPFVVPLISHAAASACNPQCDAPVVSFAYLRITSWSGNGSNMVFHGNWVDPRTQPPIRGSGVSTASGTIIGPVAFSLVR